MTNTKGLNVQLADAVAHVATANDRLSHMRSLADAARREETTSINNANNAQKQFDELVALVKKSAPRDTDWGRPAAVKLALRNNVCNSWFRCII